VHNDAIISPLVAWIRFEDIYVFSVLLGASLYRAVCVCRCVAGVGF